MFPGVVLNLLQSCVLLLCGYRSFKALESERNDDDTKWLTFWFVYTIFSFVSHLPTHARHPPQPMPGSIIQPQAMLAPVAMAMCLTASSPWAGKVGVRLHLVCYPAVQ